jgi:hypothetical protein
MEGDTSAKPLLRGTDLALLTRDISTMDSGGSGKLTYE